MSKPATALLSILLIGLSLQVGAFEYTLPDLDDQPQTLEQYRGKWVIVNYWATWCGTCRKELPELAALHRENSDIVVIGVNFESIDRHALQAFVTEQKIPFPVLRSDPVRNTPLGPVPALPTTYIINPQGKAVAGEIGMVSQAQIEDYIAAQRAMQAADTVRTTSPNP